MRRIIWVLLSIFLSGSLLTGCGKRIVSIGEMSSDFNTIEITDSYAGTTVTLDESQSQELYGKLKQMEFHKDKPSEKEAENSAGQGSPALYTLRFLKGSRELNQFAIINENTIVYDGYFYESKSEQFDLEYLMSFFYQVFRAEVIENNGGLLVAPEEGSDAYRSSDKIMVGLTDTVIHDQEGKEMMADQLKPGDILRIAFNGVILESYPAQITADRIEYLEHNLLLDGYLALIDDIYQIDSGLNSEITMLAFDTSEWVSLTESEKEIILSVAKAKYGLETLQGTFDELAEQGLIDKRNLYFKEGILIELKNMKYDEKKGTITCAISKWRGGLGAIGADAKASYEAGVWKITKKNDWIS